MRSPDGCVTLGHYMLQPDDLMMPPAAGGSFSSEALCAAEGSPTTTRDGVRRRGGLNTRQVAVLAFSITCAGPFGVEETVRSVGPALAIAGFFVTSLCFVATDILITAELSLILPLSNGGAATWALRAFGSPIASGLVATNVLLYQLVDLATYPSLVAPYLDFQSISIIVPAWLGPLLVLAVGLLVNLRHIEFASEVYQVLLVIVLLPFVIGICCAAPHAGRVFSALVGGSPAMPRPPSANLNLFVSTMVWLNTGWDSLGNLASDLARPQDMVRGMTLAAIAGLLVNVLCTCGALASGAGSWDDDFLAVAYGRLWSPLEPWIRTCASLANLALYMSELTTVAQLVSSLGDPDDDLRFLPASFSRRLPSGAPVVSLLAVTTLEVFLIFLSSFEYLVQLSTLLHVFAYAQCLAAYALLKFRPVEGERLFETPGGRLGGLCVIIVRAPILVFLLVSGCSAPGVLAGALAANAAALVICCLCRPAAKLPTTRPRRQLFGPRLRVNAMGNMPVWHPASAPLPPAPRL